MARRGRFLVLDGPDGCGKSTQARLLHARLRDGGFDALHLREPGGTLIGEKVRAILLDAAHEEMHVRAEVLLFMACRAQLVEQIIRPALARGTTVVCERFLGSSVVYQGLAGKLGADAVWRLGRFATAGLMPDLSLHLDVAPETGLSRLGRDPDRLERKALSYHRAVRRGFRTLARRDPRRFLLLSSRGTVEAVHARVLAALAERFPEARAWSRSVPRQ